MPDWVYLNGDIVPAAEAKVSVFDRAVLFADAIYEVAGVIDGKLLDFDAHMQRLDLSFREMRMTPPLSHETILQVMRDLVTREGVTEGHVYMQFSRGGSRDRDFLPSEGLLPTVFGFAQHKSDDTKAEIQNGIRMISAPDIRWGRRDIKTVGLMGSVLAKMACQRSGGHEALLHQDGYVTEGAATSFFVIKDNTVITRPLSKDILHGCTRKALMTLIEGGEIGLTERLCTLDDARDADEAFITGASTYVTPVVQIDDTVLGNGTPGPITRRLQDVYVSHARKTAI